MDMLDTSNDVSVLDELGIVRQGNPFAERAVLGCIWEADSVEAQDYLGQVIVEDFLDPTHQEFFVRLKAIAVDDYDASKYLVLQESDQLREVALSLTEAVSTPAAFPGFVKQLKEATERRQGGEAMRELERAFGDPSVSLESLRDARMRLAFAEWRTDTKSGLSGLMQSKFDPAVVHLDPVPVFSIGGTPIATPGNICSISAQAKAGKTAFTGAMVAATLCDPDNNADTFGITGASAATGHILHFDTEQSLADHSQVMRTAMRRAGVDGIPQTVNSFPLKGKTATECTQLVNLACRYLARCKRRSNSAAQGGRKVRQLVDLRIHQ